MVHDKGNLDYKELQSLVIQVNLSEVPEEDILSNKTYKYSRYDCKNWFYKLKANFCIILIDPMD